MKTAQEDGGAQELQQARERVSFLVWALEAHRRPDCTRTSLWQREEVQYVEQLERARNELNRLEKESGDG